jgi:hypothetical protein
MLQERFKLRKSIMRKIELNASELFASYEQTESVHKTGRLFGVSGTTVQRVLRSAGYTLNNRKWLHDDDKMLCTLYGDMSKTLKDIAVQMGRSEDAISIRVSKLKIGGARRGAAISQATRERMRKSQKAYSSRIGVSEARSERAKQWHKVNQHPKGFLGGKHTESTKMVIGEKSKKFNDSLSKEKRAEYSKKGIAEKIRKYGTAAPVIRSQKHYSRCKGGKRADIGIYVRSAWEANYARYLELLVKTGAIKKWSYEPKTFRFPVERGNTEYTPDFCVTEINGDVAWHEVKGWMDKTSKTKLKRFAKYYPNEKLILVDASAYRAIAKNAKSLIKEWE